MKQAVLDDALSPHSPADTDVDGLTDWAEVDEDSYLISYDDAGEPMFSVWVDITATSGYFLRPDMFEAYLNGLYDFMSTFIVVPFDSDPTEGDSDGDEYGDEQDLAPLKPFVNPVMLIHGRIDNTYNAFGLSTLVCPVGEDGVKSQNNHFGVSDTKNGDAYGDIETHIIDMKNIDSTKLGYYLINQGYIANKNLFAFNYPNQDFAIKNAPKLGEYIENIKFAVTNNITVSQFSAEASNIFATKQDMSDGRARFILIGHSNGGLVSRYYIENGDKAGAANVDKLITIDTPHYGANVMMLSLLSAYSVIYGLDEAIVDGFDESLMVPLDVELRPYSSLYTGEKQDCLKVIEDTVTNIKSILNGSYGAVQLWTGLVAMPIYVTANRMLDKYEEWRNNNPTVEYINSNQSERLNGNSDVSTKYYAVGGMNINIDSKYKKQFGDQQLVIEFEPDYDSKDLFESSLSSAEMAKYGVRYTDINSDDNIVEIFSQLGVYLSEDTIISYIDFERMTILTSDQSKNTTWNHYHSKILAEVNLHNVVIDYIND